MADLGLFLVDQEQHEAGQQKAVAKHHHDGNGEPVAVLSRRLHLHMYSTCISH